MLKSDFLDRYLEDSKKHVCWGYGVTLVPLLAFMPFAFVQLEPSTRSTILIAHGVLAIAIVFLMALVKNERSGLRVFLATFVVYVAGGSSFNLAAIQSFAPPAVYLTVGHIETMLLLFVLVRAPWTLIIPYGVLVLVPYSYAVAFEWDIDLITGSTIVAACWFILIVVGLGAYSRDTQAYELYIAQDAIDNFASERNEWERMLFRFLDHEIGTQVAGIATSFQMLSRSDPLSAGRYIERGLKSTQELQALVRRAVDAVSFDDLVESADKQILDLTFIVEEVVSEYLQASLGSDAVSLDCQESKPYRVYGDYLLLKQLFRNILDNAIRHSLADSGVEIILQSTGIVRIRNSVHTGYDFSDQNFQLGERGLSGRVGRYGMGLYLAKKIAAAHDGDITVSTTAETVEFEVSLPAVSEAL